MNLKELQIATVNVYVAFADLCNRHSLRHFAAFGTLIGAIRHKGFIPWDDDIDIWMPRPDYDKFLQCAVQELPATLKWQSIENDTNYLHPFGKVIAKETGHYIDVFPLDGLPNSRAGLFMYCVKRAILRRAADENRLPFKIISGMLANQHANRLRFIEWSRSIPYETSEYVGSPSAYDAYRTPERWRFRREWFADSIDMPFENLTIKVPKGYDNILTGIYGDYMQPPPEGQRIPSHSCIMPKPGQSPVLRHHTPFESVANLLH